MYGIYDVRLKAWASRRTDWNRDHTAEDVERFVTEQEANEFLAEYGECFDSSAIASGFPMSENRHDEIRKLVDESGWQAVRDHPVLGPKECTNCGGDQLRWYVDKLGPADVTDGRLRMSEIQVIAYLACEEWSV